MLKCILIPIFVCLFEARDCKTDFNEFQWKTVTSFTKETGTKHLIVYDQSFQTASYTNLVTVKKFSKLRIYVSFYTIETLYISLRDLYFTLPFSQTTDHIENKIQYPPKTAVMFDKNHFTEDVYELFCVSIFFYIFPL